MIERIPAMTMAGSRRNKDMVRLKQDLEERARINMMKETEAEGKAETMYVDVTRNVGVVLGELKRNEINSIANKIRREGPGEGHQEAGDGR